MKGDAEKNFLSRVHEIASCGNDMLSHGNEMLPYAHEMLSREHTHTQPFNGSFSGTILGWWRGLVVVERRSLAGELSLSCARPATDG